jgi:hypothetical protein
MRVGGSDRGRDLRGRREVWDRGAGKEDIVEEDRTGSGLCVKETT